MACSMDGKDKIWSVLWSGYTKVERPRGRISHRRKHNMKMDLIKLGGDSVDWIHVAEDTDQEAGSCKHGKPGWAHSGHFREEKDLLLLLGFKIQIVQLAL